MSRRLIAISEEEIERLRESVIVKQAGEDIGVLQRPSWLSDRWAEGITEEEARDLIDYEQGEPEGRAAYTKLLRAFVE